MRICTTPGCGTVVKSGKCDKHSNTPQPLHRPPEKPRASAATRGYDSKWRKAREGFLKKHPLCRYHLDREMTVAATVVDHIVPHRGDKGLFWDRNNWQPLCKRCHDVKTGSGL